MSGGAAPPPVLTAPLSPSLCPQTLQEQQAARAQSLAELSRWLGQAEDTLAEQQRAASEGDLSALQQRQSDVKVSAFKKRGGQKAERPGAASGARGASRHRLLRSCGGTCTPEPPPSPAS